jgi:hypothetical protein
MRSVGAEVSEREGSAFTARGRRDWLPPANPIVVFVIRPVIYLLGAGLGVAYALLLGSFPVAESPVARYGLILVVLALALAAPICWWLSHVTEARDRWTAAYVLAWVAFIGIGYLATLINNIL